MTSTTYIQDIKISISSESKPLLEEIRANAYNDLTVLMESGVFSFRNGMAEIHRDEKGKLRTVSIKQWTYKQ